MTELNQADQADQSHQPQPMPQWPDRSAQAVSEQAVSEQDPSEQALSDPAVEYIVGRLDGVPGLPVTEHEAVYAELHDALLRALNEDTPNAEGGA